jgi:hypothetical protein
MKTSRVLLVIAALGACVLPAAAIDYSKIDRTLAREPAYKSAPQYCLLVFGPEAKFRVWLVLDGGVLYVDRNGNGDLTEEGKRVTGKGLVFAIGEVRDGVRKISYQLDASVRRNESVGKGGGRWELTHLAASFPSDLIRSQNMAPMFPLADCAQDAPIVHFDGGFTLKPRRDRGVIREVNGEWVHAKGPADSILHVLVGAPVVGKDCDAFVRTWWKYPGPEAKPVAEIEFPSRGAREKAIISRFEMVYR